MTARTVERRGLSFRSLDEAVALLRDEGRRLSAARRQLLVGLFGAGRPATAEELADGLGGRIPRSDLAGVYRNLEMLERLGLVRHVHLGHAPGRYALAGSKTAEYLLCERCGDVTELSIERLDRVRRTIESDFDFRASFTHFPIVGICGTCRRSIDRLAREGS